MVLREFHPDAGLFEELLSCHQYGHGGLGRYRGSDIQNGSGIGAIFRSLFNRLFVPLVRTSAPHLKQAFEAVKPHLREAASSVATEAGKNIANKLTEVLASTTAPPAPQAGTGRKRKLEKKRKRTTTIRNLKRIPPFDLPDSF